MSLRSTAAVGAATLVAGATFAVTAFAEGRNLTNSRFEPANGFVTPGRSVLVGTRFVF